MQGTSLQLVEYEVHISLAAPSEMPYTKTRCETGSLSPMECQRHACVTSSCRVRMRGPTRPRYASGPPGKIGEKEF